MSRRASSSAATGASRSGRPTASSRAASRRSRRSGSPSASSPRRSTSPYMNFWTPDPANPKNIIRTARTEDYAFKISEFPHLIVNQARVLDYFAEAAAHGPGRIDARLRRRVRRPHRARRRASTRSRCACGTPPARDAGEERTVRAKYVAGCDGARSGVREAIGRTHVGDVSQHAWGVMDVLVVTDFPDIRTKCAINAEAGNILHIPREGGSSPHVRRPRRGPPTMPHRVRQTTIEEIIRKANDILHPYSIDVRQVAWHSVYEVGHRVTDRSTTCPRDRTAAPRLHHGRRVPHAQREGRAGHERVDAGRLQPRLEARLSARRPQSRVAAGDLLGRAPAVAQQLIDFDREWSALMAAQAGGVRRPEELADFYVRRRSSPPGSSPSTAVDDRRGCHAPGARDGLPDRQAIQVRRVVRVCDGNLVHLGHHAKADGRWRIYAFADAPRRGRAIGGHRLGRVDASPTRPLAGSRPRVPTSTPCST